MQSHRILSGLTIFLMVVLVAAGYFLVAQPQLAASAAAGLQLTSVQSQIAQSQTQVQQLKAEQQKLPELASQLKALRLSIPSSVDSSAYINGLNSVAAAAGVTITGITVGDAQAYVPPASAVTTTTPTAGATASPSPTPTATTPVAPVATGWVPTTDALITGSNFIAIPVKVVVAGSFDQSLAFMHGLQTGSRLFLVTGFVTAQSVDSTGVTATVNGYIYVIVDPKAAASTTTGTTASPAPAVTATPTATPNQSSSTTPTPTESSTPTK